MVLYLLPALGITVSTHYCGGKLADVSFFGSKSKMTCACGAMPSKNKVHLKRKCCEQVVYSMQLGNQQIKESTIAFKSLDSGILEEKQFHFDFTRKMVIAPLNVALSYVPNLPPGRYKAPIYIQNDSFLI